VLSAECKILTSTPPVPAGSRDTFFERPQRKYPKKWPWLAPTPLARRAGALHAPPAILQRCVFGRSICYRGRFATGEGRCLQHRRCWKGHTDNPVLLKVWLTLSTQQHLAARLARGTTAISSNQYAQEGQPQEPSGMMERLNHCGIRHPSRPHCPPQGKPFFAYFLLAWTKSKTPGGGATPRSLVG
jgi:hypothetical protein